MVHIAEWFVAAFITAGLAIDCVYTIVFWLFANTTVYEPGKGRRLSHLPIRPARYFVALGIAAFEVSFVVLTIPPLAASMPHLWLYR